MATDLAEINEQQLEQENALVLSQAKGLRITSQQSYVSAAEIGQAINARIRAIKDYFAPMKRKIDAAKAEILTKEKAALLPLQTFLSTVDRQMISWDDEQERKRREAERKLHEEAQRKAQELAEASDDPDTAKEIISASPPVIVPKKTPQIENQHFQTRWSADVTDLKALALAVGQGKQPLTLIFANLPVLNGLARSLKTAMNVPGVKPVEDRNVSRRL